MADSTPSRYRIYLLTIWQERSRDPKESVQWRFSLERPTTGQRQGFATLAGLIAALQQATGEENGLARKEGADTS